MKSSWCLTTLVDSVTDLTHPRKACLQILSLGGDETLPRLISSFFKWHFGQEAGISLQDPRPSLSSWLHLCAPSRLPLLEVLSCWMDRQQQSTHIASLDWCPTYGGRLGCFVQGFSFPNFQIFSAWENSGKSLENWFLL